MDLSGFTNFARKVIPCKPCGAVLVAAGSARRMGGVDKIMADLGGEPLVVRTVRAFQETAVIREIVLVTRTDLIGPIQDLCHQAGFTKVKLVVAGGATRQESVRQGLAGLSREMKLAAIADAARPLVSPQLIDRVVRAADTFHAAAPALPVKDTVKEARDGFVVQTPDRETLRAVQTPQVFDYDMIRGALDLAIRQGASITDDCAAAERMGMTVKLVEGEEKNFKITTQQDLLLARVLLQEAQP